MEQDLVSALQVVAQSGQRLRAPYHFDWPEPVGQAVCRLRFDAAGGGTVFNNLLGGQLVSRITAKGHATKGPIVALHESRRSVFERRLEDDLLFPGFTRAPISSGDQVEGTPGVLAIFGHTIDALADVALFDTPDFTSEAARAEGDVLLALLSWFDLILVVVDRERWFDRQSISQLREHSQRLGQKRLVLFNSTSEGTLSADDLKALDGQAERLAADGKVVLEFRRGRGLCLFPPGTLDDVHAFLRQAPPPRERALFRVVSQAAGAVLNQNEERRARLAELRDALQAVPERVLPSERDCMSALMTSTERGQMDVVWRVLRLEETKAWVSEQTRRLERALRKLPLVGAILGSSGIEAREDSPGDDRRALALTYFESSARRQAHEMRRVIQGSRFWDEVRRWTGLSPVDRGFAWNEDLKAVVGESAAEFARAMDAWNEKVASECQGISPHVQGAIGAGVLGVAIVLVAVPGSVTLLTLAAAKGAIAAALGKLAVAGGAGALFGKHFGRLLAVVKEKLIGCVEFGDLRRAAGSFRAHLEDVGRQAADEAIEEAEHLVLPADDPLMCGLERLREEGEAD